jgi:Xaa-Pro aminopeptidase
MTFERISKLQEALTANQAVLLFNEYNRIYFSGFPSSAGTVIITKNKAFFLIDFRYYEKAKNTVENMDVLLCERLYKQIGDILESQKIKTVFLETESISVAKYGTLKQSFPLVEISDSPFIENFINKQRSIKDKKELNSIKKAQEITDKTFSYILERIEVGRTEKEIALEMEFFMRKNGAESIAFDTIAISGKNTSLPHGVPTDKKIEKGDFFTMDFGARVDGYCSDMTRTVAVGGVNEKQKFVYDTVLKAQEKALESIKSGVVCKEIDAIARKLIYDSGFAGCFGHGLGHSVGLEIHESPAFNTRDESILQSGTVITVEPGIYIENEFGVRIEDMVYVTENGIINLTKSRKELIIL